MKSFKHHRRHDEFSPAFDAAGERLASVLSDSLDGIDASTLQHLRAAREQAVEHRRLVLVRAAQTGLSIAGHATLGQAGHPHDSHTLWKRLGGLSMVIALALGLWMINTIQGDISLQEAAEIDRILLTDDLPPAAYVDPGFKYFLKLSFPSRSL